MLLLTLLSTAMTIEERQLNLDELDPPSCWFFTTQVSSISPSGKPLKNITKFTRIGIHFVAGFMSSDI